MSERLVRFNEIGLVVPPPSLDCVPDDEHARFIGDIQCFVDQHHLYFTRNKFDNHPDPLVREFGSHPFNIVPMPRCRHVQYRGNHDGSLVPPREVIAEFLRKANILVLLGVTTKQLIDIETRLMTDNPRKAARNADASFEWYEEFYDRHMSLINRVRTFEVVPQRLIRTGIQKYIANTPPTPQIEALLAS